MVGCSAGEAHLAATETLPVDIIAETLAKGIVKQARSLNAQLIVLKEFPSRYRKALNCFVQCGFARAPSMPMTMLDIGYDSFDAYMEKGLKSSSRRKLRKKLEATAGVSDIRLSVTDDAASFVDELLSALSAGVRALEDALRKANQGLFPPAGPTNER